MTSSRWIATLCVLGCASLAFADGAPSRGGGQRGPPPEAVAACKSLSADAACSFTGRGGESVAGTCWTPDASKPLACKPDNMPAPPSGTGEGGPPEQGSR